MTESAPAAKNTDDSSTFVVWVSVAALVVAPIIAAGALCYWATRRRFRRAHYAVVAAVGSVVAAGGAVSGDLVDDYRRWVGRLVAGDRRFDVPWSAILVPAPAVAGFMGVTAGSSLAASLWSRFRRDRLGRREFLPSESQRRRLDRTFSSVRRMVPATGRRVGADGGRAFGVGLTERGVVWSLSEREVGTHTMIFGSTGCGKSETIKVVAAGLADLGWDGVIVDLKEDTKPAGLRDWVRDYATAHAVPYQELRLSNPDSGYHFDVLDGLGRDEARDAIMSLTAFDDDYYQQISKKLMGQLLRLMYLAHDVDPDGCAHPSLFEVARILSQPKLGAATKKLRAVVASRVPPDEFDIVANPPVEYRRQALSWGAKIGQVFETQAGASLLRPGDSRCRFDVTAAGLMYIGLDSQGKADLSRLVSSAVLQRLATDSAQRTTGQIDTAIRPKFIIVDEANRVDRTIVHNLLSRARSAGIAMFLATQGPKDWVDGDGDDFGRLSQNVNVAIIMKQGDPESAELCAKYLGTQNFYDQTLTHRDGAVLNAGAVRRATDYRVSPEQLRELRVGEAVVRVGVPDARLSYVKVVMRDLTSSTASDRRRIGPRHHRRSSPR